MYVFSVNLVCKEELNLMLLKYQIQNFLLASMFYLLLVRLLYEHFNDQLIISCNHYFDGIIQPVPLWDFPLVMTLQVTASFVLNFVTAFIESN